MTTKKVTPKKRKKPEAKKKPACELVWSEDMAGFWILLKDGKHRIPVNVISPRNIDLITRIKKAIKQERKNG